MPVSGAMVNRYVPGEHTDDAVAASRGADRGRLHVTLDYLGEDTTDAARPSATGTPTSTLLEALADAGLTRQRRGLREAFRDRAGAARRRPQDRPRERPPRSARRPRNAGTTVTLDMEDHTTTDGTLTTLRELRQDFPRPGAVLQAYLRRTEADCRELAHEGSRVRLCKGAYKEPE